MLSRSLKLFLTKFLNYSEYLEALRTVLRCAILNGAQKGLIAGIEHGRLGTKLTNDTTYRPTTEADYDSALKVFRGLEFPLLGSLVSHKDSSIENIMTLLHLDEQPAEKPGMANL